MPTPVNVIHADRGIGAAGGASARLVARSGLTNTTTADERNRGDDREGDERPAPAERLDERGDTGRTQQERQRPCGLERPERPSTGSVGHAVADPGVPGDGEVPDADDDERERDGEGNDRYRCSAINEATPTSPSPARNVRRR